MTARNRSRRDFAYGLIGMVVLATLQVFVVTESLSAAVLALSISTAVAFLALLVGRFVIEPADEVPEDDNAQSDWTGPRLLVTLLVFTLVALAGTLRGLDLPGWTWILSSVIALGIVLIGLVMRRNRR